MQASVAGAIAVVAEVPGHTDLGHPCVLKGLLIDWMGVDRGQGKNRGRILELRPEKLSGCWFHLLKG